MKPFFLLILTCWGSLLFAQTTKTPQLINFQAVAIDGQGNALVDSFILTRITVRQGGPNGTPYYCALHAVPTDNFGTFSFKFNQNPTGTNCNGATNPNFDQIPWELGVFWLIVEYSYNNGNTYQTIDPIELASVPYALFAAELENVKTAGAVDGQVLKFDAITKQFEPANDETAGFSLFQGDGIKITQLPGDSNIGVALADNGVTSGKLQNGAVTGSKLAPGSVSTDKLGIPAANGQVLKFDNGTWAAGTDETVSGGGTVNITGVSPGITVNNLGNNTFSIQNTGDTNSGDDLTTGTQAGGDLNGPFSNLQINAAAVGSNKLADNAVTQSKILDGAVSGSKITNGAVTAAKLGIPATNNQVLKYINGNWTAGTDETVSGGGTVNITGVSPGITVNNLGNNTFSIQNTGDTNSGDDLTTGTQAGGDLNGPFSNLQINAAAVASNELANNAVTTAKISDGAITATKLNSMSAANGQVLKYSNGVWAPGTDATGPGSSVWNTDGSNIYNSNSGNVGIGVFNPQYKLDLGFQTYIGINADNTNITNWDAIAVRGLSWPSDGWGIGGSFVGGWWGGEFIGGTLGIDATSDSEFGTGGRFYGGNVGIYAGTDPGDYNYAGYFEGKVRTDSIISADPSDQPMVVMGRTSVGSGFLSAYGPTGNLNARISSNGTTGSFGNLSLYDDTGFAKARLAANSLSGTGFTLTYGTNGSENCTLSSLGSNTDFGWIGTADANSIYKARMFVNQYGQGELRLYNTDGADRAGFRSSATNGNIEMYAQAKMFRIDHPNYRDKEIWYACVEGPEVAAYVRGSGKLIHGEVFIPFPEHFQAIIEPGSLTVIVTPNSTDTYGLAVVEKNEKGFRVKEFKDGKGNFDFDYEVKAVRKGYEGFEPVRQKVRDISAEPMPTEGNSGIPEPAASKLQLRDINQKKAPKRP